MYIDKDGVIVYEAFDIKYTTILVCVTCEQPLEKCKCRPGLSPEQLEAFDALLKRKPPRIFEGL